MSYDTTCAISSKPITTGDKVVMLVCRTIKPYQAVGESPFDYVVPICLPVYATYGSCFSVKDTQEGLGLEQLKALCVGMGYNDTLEDLGFKVLNGSYRSPITYDGLTNFPSNDENDRADTAMRYSEYLSIQSHNSIAVCYILQSVWDYIQEVETMSKLWHISSNPYKEGNFEAFLKKEIEFDIAMSDFYEKSRHTRSTVCDTVDRFFDSFELTLIYKNLIRSKDKVKVDEFHKALIPLGRLMSWLIMTNTTLLISKYSSCGRYEAQNKLLSNAYQYFSHL